MEALDKDLEGYWVRGGHADMGKQIIIKLTEFSFTATQRLDDDLAGYFETKEAEAAVVVDDAEVAAPVEEKKE